MDNSGKKGFLSEASQVKHRGSGIELFIWSMGIYFYLFIYLFIYLFAGLDEAEAFGDEELMAEFSLLIVIQNLQQGKMGTDLLETLEV